MTYAECVRILYSLGNEVQSARLGLERIQRLLQELGDPHRAGRFIHVAGTNGKGSTSAMIEAGLRAAGQRTGLYTSPHLSEPTERIQILGKPVVPERFAQAFQAIHKASERLLSAGEINMHPTYFECITAMAFLLFHDAGLDYVVLEVGMGGRLDATNVVTPVLCVITPIDLDHQQYLGDTLQKIAAEKAGIFKPGVPAVIAPQQPAAWDVVASFFQGRVTAADQFPMDRLEINARGSRFRVAGMEILCPLAGQHQVENARVAALALKQLGFGPEGIAQTVWPGRLERVSESPEIILDGAHNPAGTRALVEYIARFYADRKIWLIFGALRDKPVEEMARLLFPLADRVILTVPANSRAMPPEAIGVPNATLTHNAAEALALIRTAPPETVVFITGSLFLVGEARALLVQ